MLISTRLFKFVILLKSLIDRCLKLILTSMLLISNFFFSAHAQNCASFGTTIYVNASAGGANNGATWTDAFTDLQSALSVASTCTNVAQIWVAKGTYKPTNTTDITKSFSMLNNVGIYGGFAGGEAQLSARNLVNNPTILSGDIGIVGYTGDNSFHVISNDMNGLNSSAILDGFTITGGSGTNNGGGMYNFGSSPRLNNITFTNNSAQDGGGMANLYSSSPTLTNVTFVNNSAYHTGGGIYNLSSSPTLTNVTFANNSASLTGGGMCNNGGSSPTITNSIFWGNSGGATIENFNGNSNATVTFSDVQGGYTGTGNINADPLFVSSTDLSLQVCSPAKDVGTNTGAPTSDIISNPRPYNGIADMGAYEYQGIGGATPAPTSSAQKFCGSATVSNLVAIGTGIKWYAASSGGTALISSTALTTNTTYYASQTLNGCESPRTAVLVTIIPVGGGVNGVGTIVYVNLNATGNNDGTSWKDAFTDLQSALTAARGCSVVTQIWVAKGIYKPTGTTDRTKYFAMINNVGIYGGFVGTETQLSARNWLFNPTILSGDIGTPGNNSDNSYAIVLNNNNFLTNAALLDGFTITGANGNTNGGGMYNYLASPSLNNITFAGNSATNGGGMYNDNNASPKLTNVTFANNSAYNGGGIYTHISTESLNNVTFSNNTASNAGGGMYIQTSSPSFNNVTFSNNSATYYGGGMDLEGSSPTLNKVTFTNNSVEISGGGMYNSSSNPILNNVTFLNNSSINGGGGMWNDNTSRPRLNNVTIANNTAITGGGMLNVNSAAPVITNSIIWGNSGGAIVNGNGASATVTYSDVQGGYAGTGNISADPLFKSSTDLSLQTCSPAIDAGTNTGAPTTDIIGNVRPYNNGKADMGAYEFQGSAITAPTATSPQRLCSGTATVANLLATGTAIKWYSASSGGTALISTTALTTNTTYYASQTVNGCESLQRTAVTVIINPITTISIVKSDVNCAGGSDGSITVTATNGTAPYRFSKDGGITFISSSSPFTFSGLAANTYSIVVDGCASVATSVTVGTKYAFTNGIVYVNANAGGANNGTSWTNPYTDLQSAITAASTCSSVTQIWVAKGTYKPTDKYSSFTMVNNVAIYGGFGGYEVQLSQRNWVTNPTILSGDIGIIGDKTDNCLHVVYTYNLNNTALLDGFTITGGNNTNNFGGGMYNENSAPSLNNIIFTNNSAPSGGGMGNNYSSAPSLNNVTFVNNFATNNGGGIYNRNYYFLTISSLPSLNNVTFANNSAASGGGIYNDGSPSVIKNCIFWGNIGGSIVNVNNSSATVTYSDVQGGYPGTGNINADPLFKSSTDLSLQTCSPAIDAGTNTGASATDIIGNARPYNYGVTDMGAYEFQGISSTAPIATSPQNFCGSATLANLVATGTAIQWYAASNGGTALISTTVLTTGTTYYATQTVNGCESRRTAVVVTIISPNGVVYVDASASGNNNGTTWADAYTDLQSALTSARTCNSITQIWVAKGTYKPTSTTDKTIAFTMLNNVGIYGGFAGGETQLSSRNWVNNPTILSGDIGIVGNNTDNSYNVISNDKNGLNSTALIDGFTISGGNSDDSGGGMYNISSSPSLSNLIFVNNSASYGGGGMYIQNSSPSLNNLKFSNNSAYFGGGMYTQNSSSSLNNVTFSGNSATYGGGGMYTQNTQNTFLNLSNVTFSSNSATYGGGMYNDGSVSNFNNVTFANNLATNGGGMYSSSYSSPIITNSIFWGNSGGSIDIDNSSSITITFSDVQGGYAGAGNINADPLFVSATNLALQTCSPAIDAGTNTGVSATDIIGNVRPYNSGITDMGAYEFQGFKSTLPTTPTLADVTAECSVASLAALTTTDNCGVSITGTTSTVFPIITQGTTIVTWKFTLASGNFVTVNQNVIIKDITPPVKPILADVTAECSATPTTPTTTDNCAGTVTGTTTTTLPITTQGTTIVTWTFADGNGNSVTANQNVIIKDVTPPVKPILVDVTAECSVTPTAPTTTDNCVGTVTGTTLTVFPITTQGTTIVTWTFDDGNGNSTTATQNVIVKDVTPPVKPILADVTAECSATPTAPTTTDNCAATVTGTTSTTFPITTQGTTIVTWTFADGNGNSVTANQNII